MEMELLETARDAAQAGGRVLRGLWGQDMAAEEKGRFDYVTQADQASQEAVLGAIAQLRPGDAVLAEESAGDFDQARRTGGVLWVVDPLDGTTNFIHGFPHVAVSVAALKDGVPLAGVVLDVTRREEFSAAKGRGAWLDGAPIRVADSPRPEEALLLTGFPFREKDKLATYLELFTELFHQVSGMRRAGAAALDLAYVAAGRAQGFWELGLKPWDLAAGILIIEEAGGVVSDFHGGGEALWRGDVVAAAPQSHAMIQTACARHFPAAGSPQS